MSKGSLVLGALALGLGLLPLWPSTSPLVLALIVPALPLALVAVGLGLSGRSAALRARAPLGLPTAALVLAVAASVVCLAWLLGLCGALRRPRPPTAPPPARPPVERTAELGPGARARYAGGLTTDEHHPQPQLRQGPLFRRHPGRSALPLSAPAA
jgi:hypothetical protein